MTDTAPEQAQAPSPPAPAPAQAPATVYNLTHREEEALRAIVLAARAVLALPQEHQDERREVVAAFHLIQNAVAARPVWRELNGVPAVPQAAPESEPCAHCEPADGDEEEELPLSAE